MNENQYSFRIQNLEKSYGTEKVLDNLSLIGNLGEIFCLLGQNGSGKSTLFRILATLSLPDGGSAEIAGYDVVKEAPSVRRSLGILFQNPSLDKKLTVKENLKYGAALYGLSGKIVTKRMDEVLNILKLTDRLNDLLETLSGGLQRRVELAKVLLIRPRILLLDEPTASLDPSARIDLWNFLIALKKEYSISLFCTTHIMDEAMLANQVAILNRGKIILVGEPTELIASLGKEILSVHFRKVGDIQDLIKYYEEEKKLPFVITEYSIRFETANAYQLLGEIMQKFSQQISSITISKPTLEDLFIAKTGVLF